MITEIITSHGNADFDSFASMLAASKLYPDAKIVFSGSKETALAAFLENPYYEFDEARIRDIDRDALRRIILVDVSHSSRLGPLAPLVKHKGVEVHVYDHHPAMESDIRARRRYVRPYGSVTTLMLRILRRRRIPVSRMEATIMAMGIYEDTGFLTYRTTSPEDARQVAYLLDRGADLSLISNFLKRELTSEQLSLLNELIANAVHHDIKGVPIVIASAERDHFINDAAAVVQKQVDLQRYLVYIAVMRMGDKIHVIGRSRHHRVDIGEIITGLGGGGHATAASAVVSKETRVQVVESILAMMRSTVEPSLTAADIMNTRLHTLAAETSIADARSRIVELGVNSMPIRQSKKADGKIIGIVTRQLLDRAAAHKLRGSVREVMNRDLPLIDPESPVEEVEEYLMEGTHRCLLVGSDGGSVEGIITRMDLFRRIYVERKDARERNSVSAATCRRGHDISGMLRKRLDETVVRSLELSSRVAGEMGERIYLVGGIVRDIVLNFANKDVDIVAEQDGIAFAQRLAEESGGYARAHKRFGTAVVVFPDGSRIDVATARSESYASPGALPQVETGSLRADLYRRDFTINTLAVSLQGDRFGRLLDFFGGLRDIRNRRIRVMHSLSFIDDPTRVLRAVRFANRHGFEITEGTAELIESAVAQGMLRKISGKRIHTEMTLLYNDPRPLHATELLDQFGVLESLHKKIKLDRFTASLIRKIDATLNWFNLSYLRGKPRRVLLYYMALMEKLKSNERRNLCRRLQLPTATTSLISEFKQYIRKTLALFTRESEPRPSKTTAILDTAPLETILFIHAFANREEIRRAVADYLVTHKHVRSPLRGSDLIELGMQPGPLFAEVLNRLRQAKLDGEIANREEAKDLVRREYLA